MSTAQAVVTKKTVVAESSSKQLLKAELQKKMQLLRQEELALEKLADISSTSIAKDSTKEKAQAKGGTKENAPVKHPTKLGKAGELKAAREFQQAERALGRATEPGDNNAEPRRGRRKVAKGGLSALRGLLGSVDAPQRKW